MRRSAVVGSETGVPYLHGMTVRKDYAEKYPEIVTAFIKAIIDAGKWVEENPARAAEMLEKWTGVEKEVQYLYFSRGGHLTLDATIKPKWASTLKYDHEVLAKWKMAPALDVDKWIDDRYVRQAYQDLKLDYDKQRDVLVDPEQAQDREVLVRLRTRPLGRVDDEQEEVDPGRAGDHVADEAFMPRHVDEREPPPVGQVERRVAEVDRDPAGALLGKSVSVFSGQRPDEPRLAVVDVPGGADGQGHRAWMRPSAISSTRKSSGFSAVPPAPSRCGNTRSSSSRRSNGSRSVDR